MSGSPTSALPPARGAYRVSTPAVASLRPSTSGGRPDGRGRIDRRRARKAAPELAPAATRGTGGRVHRGGASPGDFGDPDVPDRSAGAAAAADGRRVRPDAFVAASRLHAGGAGLPDDQRAERPGRGRTRPAPPVGPAPRRHRAARRHGGRVPRRG